jgi:cyclase
MRIVDLSSPVDATFVEPDPVVHGVVTPAEGAAHLVEEMRTHFGLDFDASVLPDGEFLSIDKITLTTHTGTHVDAPAHYGTRATYGTPRTIDEMPLDWFYRPGVLVDLTGLPTGVVDADVLRERLAKTGYQVQPDDIVLLNTGAAARVGGRDYFTDFVGLDGPATELLLDLGVRVIGTDAFSLDAPFPWILERFARTGDRSLLWPAHLTGRRREFCQIERLTNLDALPPYGFTVACFPVKVRGAGAGWARAVALFED